MKKFPVLMKKLLKKNMSYSEKEKEFAWQVIEIIIVSYKFYILKY